MSKLGSIASRIKTMSLKRMFYYADVAKERYHKSKTLILVDMVVCAVKYGIGYLDYLTFGFPNIARDKRGDFMTMADNYRLVATQNVGAENLDLFSNKIKFVHLFRDFIARDFIDLSTASLEEFESFAADKSIAFAKEPTGYGGFSVTKVVFNENNLRELYDLLKSQGFFLVEEAIVQHEQMNRLSPSSVNSLRICTLKHAGEVHVMYALVRMSSGVSYVDNISSGGMYCPVVDGVITAPAYCDKTGCYYDEHPMTKTKFVGFRIPFFDEAVELVKRAAPIVEAINYVGWDVAITPNGPALIEGNTVPAYDMCQNYRHLPEDKTGIRPKFIEILGDEFYTVPENPLKD